MIGIDEEDKSGRRRIEERHSINLVSFCASSFLFPFLFTLFLREILLLNVLRHIEFASDEDMKEAF